ncbi:hypothetical protein [Haloarcula sp. Atlit-47R]|uniref:hypothetical protein n=1 Tax=Haloarcula sp. Atlit-47R TaxID=2282132 RepID=UPI001F3C9677|nr:hypothetical protein [Haloarcula sp. Atlit-47R]
MGIGDNSGQGPRAGRPLLARLAGRLGASGDRSTGTPAVWGPLTWFAVAVVAVELVGLQGYRLLTGQVLTFVQNPLWLVRPLVLLGAALATESLYRRYDRALARSNIEARVDDASRFDGLVPDRLVWLLVGLGTGFTLVNAVVILTVPQLYAAGGATRVFRFLVVTPFGYVPVLASFLATYVAVEVLLPRRIAAADVTLDYLDPEQLGGMRPVGELVKVAYYYLMVGLVAYAVATYGPHILGGALGYSALDAPGLAVNAAFTAVWVLSVGVMATASTSSTSTWPDRSANSSTTSTGGPGTTSTRRGTSGRSTRSTPRRSTAGTASRSSSSPGPRSTRPRSRCGPSSSSAS